MPPSRASAPRPGGRRGALGDPLGAGPGALAAVLRWRAGARAGRRPRAARARARGALGTGGGQRDSLLLWADDMLVELVHYPDPAGRPWPPGYRISDQGLLNIAFGFRRRAEFEAAHRALRWRPGCGPTALRCGWAPGRSSTSTTTRASASSCCTSSPGTRGGWGSAREPPRRLAPLAGRTPARLRGERRFAKALVTGAAGGLGTELCRLLAEDATSLVLLDRDADRPLEARVRAGGRGGGGHARGRPRRPGGGGRGDRGAGRRAPRHRPDDRRRRPGPRPVAARVRLAPGARRLHCQLARQPRPALAPRPGHGRARRRPRDRDRQPRRRWSGCRTRPRTAAARRPWRRSRSPRGRSSSPRGSPSRRSSPASSTRRCSAPTPSSTPTRIAPRDAAERIYMATLRAAREPRTSRPGSTRSCASRGCCRRACATR